MSESNYWVHGQNSKTTTTYSFVDVKYSFLGIRAAPQRVFFSQSRFNLSIGGFIQLV